MHYVSCMLHFDFLETIFHPIICVYERNDDNAPALKEECVHFVQMSLKFTGLPTYIFHLTNATLETRIILAGYLWLRARQCDSFMYNTVGINYVTIHFSKVSPFYNFSNHNYKLIGSS